MIIASIILIGTLTVVTAGFWTGSFRGGHPRPSPSPTPTSTPRPTPTHTPTPTSTPTPTPTPTPPSGVVWSDSYEDGASVWNYNYYYGTGSGIGSGNGGIGTLESSIVHSGNYAFQSYLPATADAYALTYKTLGNYYTTLYTSDWVRFNALPSTGNYLLIGPCICGYNDWDMSCGYLYNNGGTVRWTLGYMKVGGTPPIKGNYAVSTLGPPVTTNTWFKVQTMIHVAGNGNGEVAMWVDGTQVVDVTGITNNNLDVGPNGQIGVQNFQVGAYMPSWNSQMFSVTCWFDDGVASTSYIPYP